jgi:FAD/FMN-containing dehydrogenase
MVLKHFASCRRPLETIAPWYVLIEASDFSGEARAATDLEAALGEGFEAEIVADAAVAASLAQSRALWAIRENLSEAQGLEGKNLKHDISVPISLIAEFIETCEPRMASVVQGARPVIFGHLGDGNLHFNLSPPEGNDGSALTPQTATINGLVHDQVHAFNGSVSAEHGLGVLRRDEAAHYKSEVELQLMRAVKCALDPHDLMNPGKLLPA